MKKSIFKAICALLVLSFVLCFCACANKTEEKKSPLDAANPTSITIWNYYNGDQLASFDALVSEFNASVGTEKGIIVQSVSQGSIDNLATSLIDSADGKVGAQDLPSLASIYAETAYILNEKNLLVNLDTYFSAEELAAYVPGFIEEGRIVDAGALLLFPVSKSTECFAVNITDWAAFETATGVSLDSISTYEDLCSAAEKYYIWTDSLTPNVIEDGKALYGRDSVANYVFVGTTQLGHEMFHVTGSGVTVDLDRTTFKTLWDNYYIPFINGYFTADANHRTEDMKTGAVLAMTGSTSGVSYLPTSVTNAQDESHDITITVEKPLQFKAGSDVAVQQGAGYCVISGTEAEQYASAEFLKWFTSPDRNLQFSASSGYSPVTISANNATSITAQFDGKESTAKQNNILNGLLVGADVYTSMKTYTCKPFSGSKEIRDLLDKSLSDIAVADRDAVKQAIASGKSRSEATAVFSTDEYFDNWFNTLCSTVEETVK